MPFVEHDPNNVGQAPEVITVEAEGACSECGYDGPIVALYSQESNVYYDHYCPRCGSTAIKLPYIELPPTGAICKIGG